MANPNTTDLARPAMDSKNWKQTKSGLWIWDVIVGKGSAPKKKSEVRVHYSMWMGESDPKGTILDSSRLRGDPIEFALNEVIDGWQEGIGSMKAGGVRFLYVPADLAYGDKNKAETGIEKGADLVFKVELIEIL